MSTRISGFVLAPLVLLGGCALQPSYQRPALNVPGAWTNLADSQSSSPTAAEGAWWSQLGDPAIDQLVEAGLSDNPTLAEAAARVDQARALLTVRDAGKVPAVGIEGSITRSRGRVDPTGGSTSQTAGALGVRLSWELDLWGRVRESSNAARHRLTARDADAEGARLSVIGDIADTTIALRTCRLTLAIRDRDIASRETELKISRARLTFGNIAAVQVATAQSNLAAARTARIVQDEMCRRLVDALVALSGLQANAVRDLTLPASYGSVAIAANQGAGALKLGKTIMEATEEAVSEIAKAVIATTLSLVAVFLPTALMSGYAGLFFKPFGWTAVISVMASLLVARLLTPMMAAYFLKGDVGHEAEEAQSARDGMYISTVRWCLGHRKTVIAATIGFLAASLALLPFIPAGFLPSDDRSLSEMSIELPPGTGLNTMVEVTEEVRRALRDVDGIESVFTAIGQGEESSSGEVREASMTLLLRPRGERPSKTQIESAVREKMRGITGARFGVGDSGSERLELIIASEDSQALKSTVQGLVRELRGLGTLSNINSTASLERQEILIRPDLQRAAERGVTTEAIGDVVRVATSGDFDAQVGRLNLDNRQIFIRTRMADDARQDLSTLANLRVAGRDGLVALESVADISLASDLSKIERYDRKRFITVTADLNGVVLGDALAQIEALPSIRDMPSTVSLIPDGGAQVGADIAAGFLTALVSGILCIYCVLVLLFRDFFQPVTILSALPLSIGGAFLALFVTGGALVLTAMIGLVMLMGIVAKNSILLVEYAILGIKEHGLTREQALIEACRMRARPIIMTTVAMIAGMMPIALGIGADASFRQPMAIAVIGGLLTSTFLSLLVVPVIFELVDDLEHRARGLFRPASARWNEEQRMSV